MAQGLTGADFPAPVCAVAAHSPRWGNELPRHTGLEDSDSPDGPLLCALPQKKFLVRISSRIMKSVTII
jgi:hypothetical protein